MASFVDFTQKTGGFPSRLHEASESSKFKSFPKSPRIGHVDVEFAKETHLSVENCLFRLR